MSHYVVTRHQASPLSTPAPFTFPIINSAAAGGVILSTSANHTLSSSAFLRFEILLVTTMTQQPPTPTPQTNEIPFHWWRRRAVTRVALNWRLAGLEGALRAIGAVRGLYLPSPPPLTYPSFLSIGGDAAMWRIAGRFDTVSGAQAMGGSTRHAG